MPHLDAKALEDDPDGCAFLRSVLKRDMPPVQAEVSPSRFSQFLRQPVFAQRTIAAHLGRELRAVYATLITPGLPEHLADNVASLEAAG